MPSEKPEHKVSFEWFSGAGKRKRLKGVKSDFLWFYTKMIGVLQSYLQ